MKRENIRLTSRLTLLLDLVCMFTAYCLAAYIRRILRTDFLSGIYGNALILLLLSYILLNVDSNKDVFKRGYFEELLCIIKEQSKLWLIMLSYMFAMKQGSEYSRIFFAIFFVLSILIIYVARSYMKIALLLVYKRSASSNKVMILTVSKNAADIIRSIWQENLWQTYVTTFAIWDKDMVNETIEGLPVIANKDNLLEMAKKNVVDEVFIHIPRTYKIDLEELILEFEKMGIIVHMYLGLFGNMDLREKVIEEFAGHQVITFSSKLFDDKHVVLKRLLDVVGGIVGCVIAIILTVFVAPAIVFESPGPIFFSQIRVGKNGRKFKIYKFRSMYRDAEQRKKELLERNEMRGFMFKVTDDPRITKVGKFLRKTSIDEFPQFLNVLRGDMSLVGTRPPTEDEFVQYEGRHKRRLMLKPGLTGLWQVSGRSNIQDFEEVVRLDLEYIDRWSLKLDVKLVLKTVLAVFRGKGSK